MKFVATTLFICTFLFHCFLIMDFEHLGMNKYDIHVPSCIENIEHSRHTEVHEEDMASKQNHSFLANESMTLNLSSGCEFYNCPVLRNAWQPPEFNLGI